MTEEKKEGKMCMCGSGNCCMGGGMGMMGKNFMAYKIVKKILLLVVLVLVFCFGVQLGELKTLSHMYHGYDMNNMMGGNGQY